MITAATLAVACVDGVVGAVALWLIAQLWRHIKHQREDRED